MLYARFQAVEFADKPGDVGPWFPVFSVHPDQGENYRQLDPEHWNFRDGSFWVTWERYDGDLGDERYTHESFARAQVVDRVDDFNPDGPLRGLLDRWVPAFGIEPAITKSELTHKKVIADVDKWSLVNDEKRGLIAEFYFEFDPQPIDLLKRQAHRRVDEELSKRINDGAPVGSHKIPIVNVHLDLLFKKAILIQTHPSPWDSENVGLWSMDGALMPITTPDMAIFAADRVISYGLAVFAKAAELAERIKACETGEELEAIDHTVGWPEQA